MIERLVKLLEFMTDIGSILLNCRMRFPQIKALIGMRENLTHEFFFLVLNQTEILANYVCAEKITTIIVKCYFIVKQFFILTLLIAAVQLRSVRNTLSDSEFSRPVTCLLDL